MMERLCDRITAIFRKKQPKPICRIPLRGNAHNVIIIKAPNDIFAEAIFILRDEYVNSPASSREELLRQARASASGYAASVSVGAGVSRGVLVILTVLLALETIGIFMLLW